MERSDEAQPSKPSSEIRILGLRIATAVAVAGLCSVFVPVVPFFVGAFLLVAASVHLGAPALHPFLDPLLRVPVGAPAKRRARVLLVAGAGVLLLSSGAVGAGIHGRLHGEEEQRRRVREQAEQQIDDLLERAENDLSAGDVGRAELELLDAEALLDGDSSRAGDVHELLDRVRRARVP